MATAVMDERHQSQNSKFGKVCPLAMMRPSLPKKTVSKRADISHNVEPRPPVILMQADGTP